MDKRKISVIVPIFHGRKYITGMIAQLEECALKSDAYMLELLLVNDDPGERIGTVSSERIEVRVIETDRNRGIHASRARGLEESSGEYILFLDQDDRIVPEYFFSQLLCLKDADAVVCRLLHEGRQFYDNRMPFEQVITREYIISARNPIISPGQVLLKKNGIPEVWKETELTNNGADDWLLWLCMLAEGRKFSLNHEILFEHVVEGNNESIQVKHMIDSERELYRIIAEKEVLKGAELRALYTAVQNAEDGHIKLLSKFQKMFFVYNTWMMLLERGIYIEDHLVRKNVQSVAIYGFSYIGKRLYGSLHRGRVCVRYFIDMNAEYLEGGTVPACKPDAELAAVDMIIISLVDDTESIVRSLREVSRAEICTITELLEEMKTDDRTELIQERI